MYRCPYYAVMARRSTTAARARELTDVITRMRRALRRSIRVDYPWESRPMAQVEVLQMLQETGAIRLGDLADRLNLAQSTVSSLVGRLLADGMVERTVDPRDRRAALTRLTADGEQHLADWNDAHRRRLGRALRSLDAADRATVDAALPALARLVDALNQPDPDDADDAGSAM